MHPTMKCAFVLTVGTLAIALLTNPSLAQQRECKGECGGKYHGKKPTEEELKKILADHKEWFQKVYKPAKERDPEIQPDKVSQEGRANLCEANLSGAKLVNAVLSMANLDGADLSNAYFGSVNLSDAHLVDANLSKAIMWGVNLKNAVLRGTDLDSVYFLLEPEALPVIVSIAQAHNLYKIRYKNSPHSLVELREAFKKSGFRRQEREITYAIEHTRRQLQMRKNVREVVKGASKFVLFELTCDYGMSPGRPLWIMIFLMIFSSVPYEIVLKNTQG